MSYEGRVELICGKGHYSCYDAYEDYGTKCILCKTKWKYIHHIDDTNGQVKGDNNTYEARKKIIGVGHYTYEQSISLCAPSSKAWKKINKV